jgi:hypothetical protein
VGRGSGKASGCREIVFNPVAVASSHSRGCRLEQPELEQASKPDSGAGRCEELEKLLTDSLPRSVRQRGCEAADPTSGLRVELEPLELGEEPGGSYEPHRIVLEVVLRQSANDTGLQILQTADPIFYRTVWKHPKESVAAEITAFDVGVGTEMTEGPQLDLDLRTFDPPHAVGITTENVGSGVQPRRQSARPAGDSLNVAGQDKVEIDTLPPQQPIANIAARDVTLRSAEPLPDPTQQEIAFECS